MHGNVKDSEEGSWSEHVSKSICDLARSEGIISSNLYLLVSSSKA